MDLQPDGLFEEPERVDWDALSGQRTTVRLSWGDVECIIRGSGVADGWAYVEVERLVASEHGHELAGADRLFRVSAVAVVPPAMPQLALDL